MELCSTELSDCCLPENQRGAKPQRTLPIPIDYGVVMFHVLDSQLACS